MLRQGWNWAVGYFVPPELHEDVELLRRAQLALAGVVIAIVGISTPALSLFTSGHVVAGLVTSCLLLVALLVPFAMRATGSLFITGNLGAAVWFGCLTFITWTRGGVGTPGLMSAGVVPALALFIAGRRSAVFWALASVGLVVTFAGLDRAGVVIPDSLHEPAARAVARFAPLFLGTTIFGLAIAYEWLHSGAIEKRDAAEANRNALLSALPDVMFRLHGDGRVLDLQAGPPEYLEMLEEEIVGRHVEELIPESAEELLEGLKRCLETQTVQSVECEVVLGDQDRRFEARFAPIDDTEALVVARDLTENHQLAKQLSAAESEKGRALREAEMLRADRMASVGQLAAGVAHEVNNPLSYVIANLEFIGEDLQDEDEDEDRELRDAVTEAIEGAQRVRRIVSDLKTFARFEDERVVTVSLHSVLDSSLKMVETEVRHRAELVKRFGEAPLVHADESRLVQVFINLLVNAAHAIPEGNATENEVSVIIGTDAEGRGLVTVSDTGEGISEQNLERVTEPFFTTKAVGIGTGLGLSVSKNVIENYGGAIEIESQMGRGTTVRVRLPAAGVETLTQRPRERSRRRLRGEHRRRVLIIDDDPLVLRALGRTLRDHEVVTVLRGREALELLESETPFDVILCDLMMPDLTGMDVFEIVRDRFPQVVDRVAFMTGGAFTPSASEFLEGVANVWFEKPLDSVVVREFVQRSSRAAG